MSVSVNRGWYSRGYLPHIDVADRAQFLTWRQADALPAPVVERWKDELGALKDEKTKRELARRIEKYCDEGHGSCVLREARAAHVAERVLMRHHGEMYSLHAWVIMPNHLHVLLTPATNVALGTVLQHLKGATAHDVNEVLRRSGRLWEPDYFDRLIRNEKHFNAVQRYIEWNPVKAKLCSDPNHWQWSSGNAESRRILAHSTVDECKPRTEVRESGAE